MVFLIMKNKRLQFLTQDDIDFYNDFGLYIINVAGINAIDSFNSYYYDIFEVILSILVTVVYRAHYNDVQRVTTTDETTSRLLHSYFNTHLDIICQLSLAALVVETIFLQTVIQAFILVMLILKLNVWAFNMSDNRQQLRYLVLTFSQLLLLCQLVSSFALQIPVVYEYLIQTEVSMFFDMFGVLLNNLQSYIVVFHQLSITFALTAIQLYKVVRENSLMNPTFAKGYALIGDEELEVQHHSIAMRPIQQKKNTAGLLFRERTKTVAGGSAIRRASAVEKMKGKAIDVKNRINDLNNDDDSQIQEVA